MKIKRIVATVLLTVLMVISSACTNITGPFVGDWAYNHDPATSIINLKTNGSAVFNGQNYTYEVEEPFIILKNGNEEQRLRYYMDDDILVLYQTTSYKFAGEGEPDGVIGFWMDEANNWTYEFTTKGTFMEDEHFPGHYTVNEDEGTILLVYNDMFEDTTIYYTLDGDTLTVEYPWKLVKTTKDDGKDTK